MVSSKSKQPKKQDVPPKPLGLQVTALKVHEVMVVLKDTTDWDRGAILRACLVLDTQADVVVRRRAVFPLIPR